MTPMRTEGCGYGKTWCSCTSCSSNRCAWFFKEVCGSKRQSAWRSERWKYLWASWKLVVSATTVRKTLKKMMIVFMSHKHNHYLLMSSLFTKVQSVESRARCGGCSHILDGGADLFAHFREFDGNPVEFTEVREKVCSAIIPSDPVGMRNGPRLVWLKDLFPRYFWMQSLLPSTVHVTKKHSSWFDLVRILTIPDAKETRGDNFAAKPILCFVKLSKLFDVYSKLSSTWIFCSIPGVFFPSFHLYLKWSSDLDRVGSMVGKQDWLNKGDRVQFAEMMDERSSAEFTWTELLIWATFDSDVYSAASGCMFWHLVPNRNS